jgi:hypothetical protein
MCTRAMRQRNDVQDTLRDERGGGGYGSALCVVCLSISWQRPSRLRTSSGLSARRTSTLLIISMIEPSFLLLQHSSRTARQFGCASRRSVCAWAHAIRLSKVTTPLGALHSSHGQEEGLIHARMATVHHSDAKNWNTPLSTRHNFHSRLVNLNQRYCTVAYSAYSRCNVLLVEVTFGSAGDVW